LISCNWIQLLSRNCCKYDLNKKATLCQCVIKQSRHVCCIFTRTLSYIYNHCSPNSDPQPTASVCHHYTFLLRLIRHSNWTKQFLAARSTNWLKIGLSLSSDGTYSVVPNGYSKSPSPDETEYITLFWAQLSRFQTDCSLQIMAEERISNLWWNLHEICEQ
jgi:hypothetical protein